MKDEKNIPRSSYTLDEILVEAKLQSGEAKKNTPQGAKRDGRRTPFDADEIVRSASHALNLGEDSQSTPPPKPPKKHSFFHRKKQKVSVDEDDVYYGHRKLAFVPILRAGLGMVDGVLEMVPAAKVGHIGLYRDHETLQPVEYYSKLPLDINERDVIVLDPMLATGGSAMDAITIIKRSHPKSIKFMCIIAAPEGLKALTQAHPDVQVYCAAVDDHLNEIGYIVPGLGDAGDRIFGTL